MEATLFFMVAIVGLAALGMASQIWGADTRDSYEDDHTR